MALKIGHRLADYTIDAVLGGGGMGDVYKVTNGLTGGEDAAKLLKPELTSDPAQLKRFLQEIRTLAKLNHENIVALRTALTVGDQLMMVMEYVDGDSLDKISGKLRELEGLMGLAAQLLRAFQYAHEKGVIHRDIKPQNIMVAKSGQAKVLDFGIARIVQERRMTPTGFMVGSPHYMSPEQIKGEPVDARTDIYSLGIVLYETITNRLPFDGTTFYEIWRGHLHVTPTPPGEFVFLPRWLNDLILRAIAKDPAQRFGSAQEMLEALELGLSGKAGAVTIDVDTQTPVQTNGDRRDLAELTSQLTDVAKLVSQLAGDATLTKQATEGLIARLDVLEHRVLQLTEVAPQTKPEIPKQVNGSSKGSKDNRSTDEFAITRNRVVIWSAWITLATVIVIVLSYLSK